MSWRERLRHIESQLDAQLEHIKQKALESRAADDPHWDAFLVSMGVTPLDGEARMRILASGAPKINGAFPAEVRSAFTLIQKQALESLDSERAMFGHDGGFLADHERLDRKARYIVDERMRDYINCARPKVTLGGIFANAANTSTRHERNTESVNTETCGCCGAARPADTSLNVCAFCGSRLFDNP